MPDLDLKIRSRDIHTLISIIEKRGPDIDISVIRKAYEFAQASHRDQKRFSGEPFIIHPLEVAIILADFKLDTATIAAALLHDVVEDTGTALDVIKTEFGTEVAELVDGVTNISSLKKKSRATAQAETLRKMLMATIKDIRVIIIKLADKLHNMRTLMFLPQEKQVRIARETMDIYAPLARRLGMSKISSELEDIGFYILHHDEYMSIKNNITHKKHELESFLDSVRTLILARLSELKIEAEITGRAKHYFSIYKKMRDQHKSFDEIYDIRAIRIITREIKECYGVLGVVHTIWTPIAARFKDYIAVPKSNMYQSLHTTVIGPDGHPLEVQIRTEEMHATAEMGIAAHWLYKEHRPGAKKDYKNLTILKNIGEIQDDEKDPREFMKNLKMDLYDNEIFVFTPQGKIIKLPQDSTPVDFAYAIHTEIGHHTVGAKVNNRMVPLKTRLAGGDIIEIMTNKKGHPSEAWLKFVISSSARYKIRSWFRKQDNLGEEDEESRQKEQKTVKVTIPSDEQSRIRKLSHQKRTGVTIDGQSDVLIRLSQCCQPIPGDDVVGFITRGRGITIHKKTCQSLKRLQGEKERFVNIVWKGTESSFYPVKIAVEGIDRQNLLKDITDELSLCKTNIIKAEAHLVNRESAMLKFTIEVHDRRHMQDIISRIKSIKNITNVYKLNEKVVLK